MLNNISSETGEVLGRVNTIQNANTQNLSLSLNFDKIYRTIPWLNKNEFIISDLIKSLKRVRFNYSENSGKVLPGYIPSIGFLGTAIGMIIAFFNMAKYGDQGIDITLLSEGIYLAMTTTVAGLIVGILAYFSYNYLVAKIAKAVYQMESTTIEFLDLIYDKKHN